MNGGRGEGRSEEPTRAQRAIARRAAESRATIPHLERSCEVVVTSAPVDDLSALLVKACALALRAVPRANGSYRDGRFELHSRVNVGISVETDEAFAIPTLFDADRTSIEELSAAIGDLRERGSRGELLAPELSGGTFTLYELRVSGGSPLIVPPQAAALAAGAVRSTPVLRGGAVVPGQTITLTLACDHRIMYGSHAEDFLAEIAARLQERTS